jgi:hypothetical protein
MLLLVFVYGVAVARQFTLHVVAMYRRWDGQLGGTLGAFVVLNPDGWIATAAHLFDVERRAQRDKPLVYDLRQRIANTF